MSATTQTAVSTHVAAFSAIEQAVKEFEKRHKDVVHDCKTTDGDKAARKDRQEVQQHITSIEAKRVELTEPHLTAQRAIMAIATGYKDRLTTLKTNYDTQIKAEETRKAEVKRAAELEAQRKRDEAAAAERAEAAKREQELREQNERLQAELAAAKAAAAPATITKNEADSIGLRGWSSIEADEAPANAPGDDLTFPIAAGFGGRDTGTVEKITRNLPSCDSDLLDLLDSSTAHAISTPNRPTNRVNRPANGFALPTAQQVADALTDHAKKRTSIRNVCDVLDAIRALMAD
jgi:membrane protein involved in colicin uptake